MRKVIKLTESDLTRMVRNVVNMINEAYDRRGIFIVLKMLPEPENPFNAEQSRHMSDDRWYRTLRFGGLQNSGTPMYSFVVDTGHPKGDEIHTITDKACIIIQNEKTKRIVTMIYATPGNIKRYWRILDKPFPRDEVFQEIISKAVDNVSNGLNI